MTVNGKQKGAEGEREVVALLRAWWEGLEPAAEFARTPGSGGWQGQNHRGENLRGNFRMSGDVMTTSLRFPFSVEVKRRENWSLDVLQAGKPSAVWQWWCQCQKAAAESSPRLAPILWMRRSRERWWVMLPVSYAAQIAGLNPEVTWTARQLLRVDCGQHLPALFKGSAVLTVDPLATVVGFQCWVSGTTTTRVVVT